MPQRLGRFEVVRKLGEGGMGAVYEGVDRTLDRHVALKVLNPEIAQNPEFRERFRREAVAMAHLAHPHVLSVYELGEHEGMPFFAMELVDGGDCQGQLTLGPLAIPIVVAWIDQAAQGLASAAARGLVHRDVKPANLMLHQGQVKVSDFGIAREVEGAGALTRVGMVMGTPDYIAPEQAMAMTIDHRADIYALGATFYHLLVGRPLFSGTPTEVMQAQADTEPPDPRVLRPEIPAGLAEALARMLAKRPEDRPQTYADVQASLAPFLEGGGEAGVPGSLVFTEGALAGRKVELPLGEFVVGRGADCNLVLDGQNASRRHALFLRDAEGLRVRDLGSRNGVLVNGVRVTASRLRVGDRVRVGSDTFAVAASDAAEAVAVSDLELGSPRLTLLRTLSQTLAHGPREAFFAALQGLVQPPVLGVNRCALLVWEAGKLRPRVHIGRTEEDKAVTALQSAIALAQAQPQLVMTPDARVDPRFQTTSPVVAAVLCQQVSAAPGVIAVLYADAREPRAFTADDAACFATIASLTSLALKG